MLNSFTLIRAGALSALVVLSACAQAGRGIETALGDAEAYTPAEQALLDQSRDIVQRSALQGAALGAAAGCGVGVAADNSLAGCLIGAIGGAIVGGAAGAAVGQGNADAAATLDNEDELIAELKEERARLAKVETALNARIADQNRELASLNKSLASKQIDAATYSKRYRRIADFRKDMAASLASEREAKEADLARIQQVSAPQLKSETSEAIKALRRLEGISSNIAPPAIDVDA